jgi:hypothetical protein
MRTRRLIVIALSGLALIGAGQVWRYQHRDGCRAYVPASGPLVAHAGGGLPEQTYANNLEALDLAASHGFTMVELDFLVEKGRLVIGHDADHRSSLSPAGLMRWLDAHPRVSVVTDFKSDNLSGLALLRLLAGERAGRFIPQIYAPGEFAPVVAMGYPTPILTAYRLPDRGWQQAANALLCVRSRSPTNAAPWRRASAIRCSSIPLTGQLPAMASTPIAWSPPPEPDPVRTAASWPCGETSCSRRLPPAAGQRPPESGSVRYRRGAGNWR